MKNEHTHSKIRRAVFANGPLMQPAFASQLASHIQTVKESPAAALKSSLYGSPLEKLTQKKQNNGKSKNSA